jgi:uncharacterized beta-barrel protein YwiB (DUF1934 family)
MNRLIKAGENVNVRACISRIPESYDLGRTGELAHLEKAIYSMPPEKYPSGKGTLAAEDQGTERSGSENRDGEDSPVHLVKASSVYAEAETAAAHVMHLVRDRGFAYRDIILICNDKGVLVSYQETELTGLQGTTTMLRINGPVVTLLREGTVNSQMVFEEGVAHESLYQMAFGTLMLTVKASFVYYDIVSDGGTIDLSYNIDIENTEAGVIDYHLDIRAK